MSLSWCIGFVPPFKNKKKNRKLDLVSEKALWRARFHVQWELCCVNFVSSPLPSFLFSVLKHLFRKDSFFSPCSYGLFYQKKNIGTQYLLVFFFWEKLFVCNEKKVFYCFLLHFSKILSGKNIVFFLFGRIIFFLFFSILFQSRKAFMRTNPLFICFEILLLNSL